MLVKLLLFFFFLSTTVAFYIKIDQNQTDIQIVSRTKRALPAVGIKAIVVTVGREVGKRILVTVVNVASRFVSRVFPRVWRFIGGVAEEEVTAPLAPAEEQSLADADQAVELLEGNEVSFNEINEGNDLGFNEIEEPNDTGNDIFEYNDVPNEVPEYNEVQGEVEFFNDLEEEGLTYNKEPNDDLLIVNLP